ncbi:MAG: hypothetical protein QW692_00515 [Nitrososphaerota archaeon]
MDDEVAGVLIRLPRRLLAKVRARAGQVGVSMNQLINAYISYLIDDDGFHEAIKIIKNAKKGKEG